MSPEGTGQPNPCAIALAFVERINAGDVDGIVAMLTEDHEFIDTADASSRGRETLRDGWHGYFGLFPDYRIEVERIEGVGSRVILVGRSSGTLSDAGRAALRRPDGSVPGNDELQGPAIWTALIQDGQLAQWCVYLDKPETRAALGLPAS